ncbi:MAG: hypothetical protein OJF61_000486 [Rhodanobacteraceae bacterium]|jgi:uncharacterized lipoprotein|nr:MAG: hypothetical protein OJF61_000486 [Rhodanobacteraceae bacterium]
MHNAPMKRILIPLFLFASVALAGCQTIKAHNPFRHKEPAYKSAQQEQPLEVPPGMDQPPTTEALAIPDAGNGAQTAAPSEAGAPPAAQEAVSSGVTASGNSLSVSDTPDSVYRRVGLALARGDAGQVTASDDAAHTYQVAVDTIVTRKPEGGFLHRMFHHSKNEAVKGTVTVSVAPSGSGSVVTASGDADASARVMAVLQQRLGGG